MKKPLHSGNRIGPALVCLLEGLESRRMFATLTTLVEFTNFTGVYPYGSLALSGDTLYGSTLAGGVNNRGTVFSVPIIGGPQLTLASFDDAGGSTPVGGMILSGNTLYGTTQRGGANGVGRVFSLPITGGTPTTLATFNTANGSYPSGNLTVSGNTLYGTTLEGGANDSGTVFSLPVAGGAPTTLVTFNRTNGARPYAGLTLSGNTLYGTTEIGGATRFGTVFSVPITGDALTTLATFNGINGAGPLAGLTLSGDTLYGTTQFGGANRSGTVFSVPITGGAVTTLATFDRTNGAAPFARVTLSGNTLYGTTDKGGANNRGTVFAVPVAGGAITTLVTFNGTNGEHPRGDLTLAGDTLYGTTYDGGSNGGTVFKVTDIYVPPALPSEVAVFGNGVEIVDGDVTPAGSDLTDFGPSLTRTFTVKNTGGSTLMTSNLRMLFQNSPAGAKSKVFTITEGLSPSIAPGASDTFTLRFNPETAGHYTRYVYFDTNDVSESRYNFAIKASEKPLDAEVRGNNVIIADASITPSSTDGTNFGTAQQNATSIVRTFTLRNTGATTSNLSGAGIFFPGQSTTTVLFDFVTPPPTTVLAGETVTFSIRLNTQVVGTFTREVRFATNGPGQGVYSFYIKGAVTE